MIKNYSLVMAFVTSMAFIRTLFLGFLVSAAACAGGATPGTSVTGGTGGGDGMPCDTPQDCPLPPNECVTATCSAGMCGTAALAAGTTCNDGNACTYSDACQDGACVGNALVCNGGASCIAGACVAPVCTGVAGFPPKLATGDSPTSVVTADFDSDSKPDLAVANSGSNTVSVLLHNGSGSFAPKVDYATDTQPISVAAADLNGDNKPDLAVANYSSDTVSVLLNNGDGTFAANVNYSAGTTPASITVADFDGDGKPDLVVTNNSANTVSVLLNNGNGTFAPKVDYPAGGGPVSVAVADFDGNGKPDLAVASMIFSSGTVGVLLNSGNGTFAPKVDYATNRRFKSIAAADLNGDGKPDLAVGHYGDGVYGGVSVLLNNGNGTFAPQVDYTSTLGTSPDSIEVADLNGDGKPDLAVAYAYGRKIVSVLLNNGNGTFAAAVDYPVEYDPTSVAPTDLNGDGKADLAVTDGYTNTVSVLFNNGNGTFTAKVDYPAQDPCLVAAADLNGDGKPDLAVAEYFGKTTSVWVNNGDGTFDTKVDYPVERAVSIAVADLNGDGKPDHAVAHSDSGSPGSGNVGVLLNNGDGTFAAKVDYPTDTDTYPIAVVALDLNGDGKPDLAVANESQTVSVLLNNGNGTFAAHVDYTTSSGRRSLATGDLNGDGKPDLAVANYSSDTVSVLLNNGDGTFAAKIDHPMKDPTAVEVADLNGDGKLDLAVANSTSIVSVLLNNGNGSFAAKVDYAFDTAAGVETPVVAVDVNGDGNLDLAVVNQFILNGLWRGALSVLLNKGDGTFAAKVDYYTWDENKPSFNISLAVADLNGDGRPDFAVTNDETNAVSVLFNACLP